MARIVDSLTEPQTARARMRAGSGFEAEASVTVSPVGLLAVGGLVAAILLSVVPIVRARQRGPRLESAVRHRLTRQDGVGAPPALPPPDAD